METLPEEIKFKIIGFINFKDDMLTFRILNKNFKHIMDKKITLEFPPEPTQESLTELCLLYKDYIYEKLRLQKEANLEYEKMNIDMLIENGWI